MTIGLGRSQRCFPSSWKPTWNSGITAQPETLGALLTLWAIALVLDRSRLGKVAMAGGARAARRLMSSARCSSSHQAT